MDVIPLKQARWLDIVFLEMGASLEPLRIRPSYSSDDLKLPIGSTLEINKVANIFIEFPKVSSCQDRHCPVE